MATAKKAAATPAASAKKTTATKAAASPAAKAPAPGTKTAASKSKAGSAFMKPLTPSAELAAIVGKSALPRTEAIKKVWDYIKKHQLQDAADKRMINADAKFKAVLGKDQVSMFEMTKLVSAHLS